MPGLFSDVKELISTTKVFPLATASKEGIPNVIPVGCLKVYDESEETLLLVDNYFGKTMQNIKENPRVSTCVWDLKKKQCFQIKGHAAVFTEGKVFEDAVAWIKDEKPHLNPKSAILIKVDEIYICMPGPDLGKKV